MARATRQPHFVQGEFSAEGRENWVTLRVYNNGFNFPADALAEGCAKYLAREASKSTDYPGEDLPTRTRVVSLTELLEQGPEALHAAITDLFKRSPREHVIRFEHKIRVEGRRAKVEDEHAVRIRGRGKRAKFA